jgi:hypothetical protein
MAGFSAYLQNKALDKAFSRTDTARVGTLYFEPYKTMPAIAGTGGIVPTLGYSARVPIANNSTNFPPAVNGVKTLAAAKRIYTATGGEVLVGGGLWDAPTGGNLLALVNEQLSLTTRAGQSVRIPPSSLTLSLAGGWSAALANAALDHFFGGPDWTPAATLWFGLGTSVGEIAGSGYARVAIANNLTSFPAASGGQKATAVDVSFGPATAADWVTATRFRIYDASTAGTLLLEQDLDSALVSPALAETATLDAGQVVLTLI